MLRSNHGRCPLVAIIEILIFFLKKKISAPIELARALAWNTYYNIYHAQAKRNCPRIKQRQICCFFFWSLPPLLIASSVNHFIFDKQYNPRISFFFWLLRIQIRKWIFCCYVFFFANKICFKLLLSNILQPFSFLVCLSHRMYSSGNGYLTNF